MSEMDIRLLLLSPADTVYVLRARVAAGETIAFPGGPVAIPTDLSMGHKLARGPIKTGEKIIKYGAPIGSATRDIALGDHVHIHNVKSDYTQTHSLDDARAKAEGADA